MKKTVKVVMLPTEKASNIALGLNNILISTILTSNIQNRNDDFINQHLYLISDDEIKEGDWFIGQISNQVYQARSNNKANWKGKKIIATTDNSINVNYPIAEIPESFIQAYIKAYNEGSPITEVTVEYEETTDYSKMGRDLCINRTFTPKTRAGNTVIIHQSKLYTRDDMIKAFDSGKGLVFSTLHLTNSSQIDLIQSESDKWIQDNL